MYSYTGNSPVNYVDPTGHIAGTLLGGALGFIIGGVWGVAQAVKNGEDNLEQAFMSSAVTGAVIGAAAGLIVDTGGISTGASVAIMGTAGIIGGAVGEIVYQDYDLAEMGAETLGDYISGYDYGKIGWAALKTGSSAALATLCFPADFFAGIGGLSAYGPLFAGKAALAEVNKVMLLGFYVEFAFKYAVNTSAWNFMESILLEQMGYSGTSQRNYYNNDTIFGDGGTGVTPNPESSTTTTTPVPNKILPIDNEYGSGSPTTPMVM